MQIYEADSQPTHSQGEYQDSSHPIQFKEFKDSWTEQVQELVPCQSKKGYRTDTQWSGLNRTHRAIWLHAIPTPTPDYWGREGLHPPVKSLFFILLGRSGVLELWVRHRESASSLTQMAEALSGVKEGCYLSFTSRCSLIFLLLLVLLLLSCVSLGLNPAHS